MNGNYVMARGWMDHDIFEGEPYSKRDAWIWMIENAVWKDKVINIKGKPVKLKRGQLSFSVRFMEKKFNWKSGRVQRFLEALKNRYMIATENTTGQLIITICNYSNYQLANVYSATPEDENSLQERYKEEYQKINNNITPPIIPPKENLNRIKKISSIEEIEKHPLDGHYRNWFEENCPNVDIEDLRLELILYCRSKNKKYKDYWATLQVWGRRRQKEVENGKRTGDNQLEGFGEAVRKTSQGEFFEGDLPEF